MAGATDTEQSLHRSIAVLVERGGECLVVADALARWAAQPPGEALTLDAILELPHPWRAQRQRALRDAALQRLRDRLCPTLYGRTAAQSVTDAVRRYQGCFARSEDRSQT
jgi:hypothetical protein